MKSREQQHQATGTDDGIGGGLSRLGREVSEDLERAREREAVGTSSRVREKLLRRETPAFRAAQKKSKKPVVFVGTAALAVAASIALYAAWPSSPSSKPPVVVAAPVNAANPAPASLSFTIDTTPGTTGAFIAAPPAKELPVTFSDGSRVRLAPAARARVAQVGHDGARVLVESGTVHVAVVHRDEATKWAVEAGPFEVRVTGTKFDLSYDPNDTGTLIVKLEEGSVFVRGCGMGEGRRLNVGEQLRASCKDLSSNISPIGSASVDALPDAPIAAAPLKATAPSPAATPSSSSEVVALAKRGAHAEALAAAESNGGFAHTCESMTGSELLLLADAARYAGRFDRANEALSAARKRFAGSDSAAIAVFELGRIAMDVKRDLPAAGDHFETYLRERPTGSLAREALGRALEARQRAGDQARAERLAIRYLDAYPDGPHAKLAQKLRDESN